MGFCGRNCGALNIKIQTRYNPYKKKNLLLPFFIFKVISGFSQGPVFFLSERVADRKYRTDITRNQSLKEAADSRPLKFIQDRTRQMTRKIMEIILSHRYFILISFSLYIQPDSTIY